MDCAYHEGRAAIKECIACSKPLCEGCHHSDYPAYCWSCGYEHEQRQMEEEKGVAFPAFLEHKIVFYVLHKAFSAVGASFIAAFTTSIIMSMLAGAQAMVLVFYIGLFMLIITSVYGVLCSIVIDIIARCFSVASVGSPNR